MARVTVHRIIPNLVITDRLVTHLRGWTRDAMNRIRPTVPYDTGALSKNTATAVKTGPGKVVCWFYWKQPYASIVEDAWGGRYSPRMPGTRAPYGVPGVTAQAQGPELGKVIGRALSQ